MFTIALWVYEIFGCLKILPVNFTLILLPWWSINGVKLLSDVAGGLIVLSDGLLDCHDEIYFALVIILKYLLSGWNTK